MDLKLAGKVAIVTGGSRGIGKAICLALAAEGAHVVVNYCRNREKAQAVAGQILAMRKGRAVALRADMGREQDIAALFETAERRLGTVDILVNNAAYCPSGPVTSYSRKEWERTFSINVTGVFLACQELVRRLRARKGKGKIVNMASQAAFLGSTSGHLPYDASKGALVSLTRALARELAEEGTNVNAVAPGMVLTEMVEGVLQKKLDAYLSRIPLKRIARPEEIADIVVFLASDAAAYLTGTTLDVTGGVMMR